ncbi:MAG TPA: hypothetical protein VH008_08750 [Pseudonocardia sp.]|nr:hypothetical protein [Pseudonocardia sp.]
MTADQPWPARPVPGPPRHAPEPSRPVPRPGPPPRPPQGAATAPVHAGTVQNPAPQGSAAQPAPQATAGAGEPAERVAAALAGLDRLDTRPTGEHVAAFERVHVALTDALSAIDGV